MVSVIFTITPDLDKVFPAVAARKMGIVDVPLLDMSEPEIDGALKKCIRILMHINSDKQNKDMVHAYLRGATVLRPDLGKINLKENKMKYISVAVDGPAGSGQKPVKGCCQKSWLYIHRYGCKCIVRLHFGYQRNRRENETENWCFILTKWKST